MTIWKTSDMNGLFVCALLLLLKVSFAESCASGKYTESGQCCSMCRAGFGVVAKCGKEDTKCQPCPEGTFSSSESLEPCVPCTKCPSSVPTVAACSSTVNTLCECDSGYFLLSSHGLCAPCSRCTYGQGVFRECGPQGDTDCRVCGPGTFIEDTTGTKPCQNCTTCSENMVEIRACMPQSNTVCMDKKLHILSPPESDAPRKTNMNEVIDEDDMTETSDSAKFTPHEETNSSNNILAYVSVPAAVVLGLLIYVAYKCWRTCKQKKALIKARAAEVGTSTETEKLQSDSGVFLDSHMENNQTSKGTKRDSKLDNRLYVNLSPHRREEVESLLQEGGPGWRELGAVLGYESEQLELFGRGEAPAHTLLSNWAQKEASTLGHLSSALARIERLDVVTALMSPSQGVSVV